MLLEPQSQPDLTIDQAVGNALWAISEGVDWYLRPHAFMPGQTVPGIKLQYVKPFDENPYANLNGLDDFTRKEWKVFMFGATMMRGTVLELQDEQRYQNMTYLEALTEYWSKVMGHYGAAAVTLSSFQATVIFISREKAHVLVFPAAYGLGTV